MSRHYSFENLNALREARGMTWYRLGVDAGMDRTISTQAYLMRHAPQANRLAALADALGCSMDDLFEEVPDEPDAASEVMEATPNRKRTSTPTAKKVQTRRKKKAS